MKTCDEYQLDLERRRRGALGPAEAEEAARHLAGCQACRVADELADRTHALLSAAAKTSLQSVDWNRLGRRIDRERRAYRALPWVTLGTFIVIGFGAGALFSPEGWLRSAVRVSAIGVVFAVGCAVYAARKLRAAERASASGGEELLEYRRRELDAQVLEARRMWLTGPLMVVPSVVGAVLTWDNAYWAGPALLIVAALLTGATVHALAFELPRLRRERAELS